MTERILIVLVCAACSSSATPPAVSPSKPLAWMWEGPPPTGERPSSIEWPPGTLYRYVDVDGEAAILKKETDLILWRHPIGRGRGAAAFALDGDVVYAAHYSPIASGAELFALRAKDGTEVWHVQAEALGPVSHSQYLNAIELRVIDGALVVFGWEAGGRYIETHALADGRQLSNRHLGQP